MKDKYDDTHGKNQEPTYTDNAHKKSKDYQEDDAYTPYKKENKIYADYEDETAFLQADVLKPRSDVADSYGSKSGKYRPPGHNEYGKSGSRGHDNRYGADRLDGYTYGDYAQKKSEDYEEDDTYMPYKKDDNYDYYGKNHKYTYGDNEESTLATILIRNPTTIRGRRMHALQKETYYDRRQQRVPPRSLLPGDLFGNGSASQALGL